MVEKDLLDILVCPDDLTPLRLASAAELAALNARIVAGQVKTGAARPSRRRSRKGSSERTASTCTSSTTTSR